MSQLHKEFLLKTTIQCPNQTQSRSILVLTALAAVLTSIFYETSVRNGDFSVRTLTLPKTH